MGDVERLVASLVRSDAPLDRSALLAAGRAIAPEVAPLAPAEAVEQAVDSIVGLGPLEPLVDDPLVTDILVNGADEVWVERDGTLERTHITFRRPDDVIALIRRVVAPLGLRIDRSHPAVDARLPDGSRLHAIIPPASVDGPILAIRRFTEAVRTVEDLHARGAATRAQVDDLHAAVADRSNILVAGQTGAGKTTVLNVLCGAVPPSDRVVTIEDAAELRPKGHAVRLEAHIANVDGAGAITMRQLVRHAMRLRPDRIVVGEVRGPEALDMVQALTTGHRGSMSTIHASTAAEALFRLEMLASMAPEAVPHRPLEGLVRSAIDVVVVVERTAHGRRIADIERVGEQS